MNNTILEKKLENIETELSSLKSILIKLVQHPEQNKVIKLKGQLKGITVDEKDIKEAKKSLFRVS